MEPNTDDEDSELDEKVSRILEMFPQLTRIQLLDVSFLHHPHLYNFFFSNIKYSIFSGYSEHSHTGRCCSSVPFKIW